jgi:hypothetical protein
MLFKKIEGFVFLKEKGVLMKQFKCTAVGLDPGSVPVHMRNSGIK